MIPQTYKKYLSVICLSPLFLLPLIFSFSTVDPVLHPRFTVLSGIIIVMIITGFILKFKLKFKFYYDLFFIIYLAYFFSAIISLIVHPVNVADGVTDCMKIFLAGSFIFLASNILKEHDNIPVILTKTIIIVSTIFVSIGLFQLLVISSGEGLTHQTAYQISSTFANKNIFAEILLMVLPFSVYSFVSLKKIWKIAGILLVLIELILIFVLLTRAVWFAAIVSFLISIPVFWFFYFRKKPFQSYKKTLIISTIIFTIGLLTVWGIYSKFGSTETLTKQVKSITGFTYGSTKDRIELWKKTFGIFKEHPLVGSGTGSWKIEILKYGNQELKSEDNKTFYQQPHNDFLWILTEQGIFGLILFLSIIGLFYKYLFSVLSKNKDRLFYLLIFYGFTSYLLFSFLSFPKERIEHIVFLGAFIIPVIIAKWKADKFTQLHPSKTSLILVLLFLISFFSLILGGVRIQSEIHTLKSYKARAQYNWKEVIQETDKALSCFYQIDPISTPLYWYRGLANFNIQNIKEAKNDFEKAYIANPYHIHVINNLGTCYSLSQQNEKAINLFKEALKIAPNFIDASLNLCASYFNLKQYDLAYQTFEQIEPDTLNYKFMQFLPIVVGSQLEGMIQSEKNKDIVSWYQRIIKDKNWFTSIYLKSKQNKISFFRQLMLDFTWFLKNNEKNINLAAEIEKQYL